MARVAEGKYPYVTPEEAMIKFYAQPLGYKPLPYLQEIKPFNRIFNPLTVDLLRRIPLYPRNFWLLFAF